MADYKKIPTLLGYEDGLISEKNKHLLNFKTNKIGGKPIYPEFSSGNTINPPNCIVCQLPQFLVVQIYAPLENSLYHRIFYLFACINPKCWDNENAWSCQRLQYLDKNATPLTETLEKAPETSFWCQGSNDWDDGDINMNIDEENGNAKVSDEDESSNSFKEIIGLENLTLKDQHNANDQLEDPLDGGAIAETGPTAEIEGKEGEDVSIDTPTGPDRDYIFVLMERPKIEKSFVTGRSGGDLFIVPYFMSVYDEEVSYFEENQHIRELLQEYKCQSGEIDLNKPSIGGGDAENYETVLPPHGDKMFHSFMTKIEENPGQLLRYQRGGNPLLLCPLKDVPKLCAYCKGNVSFEFQILPSLVPFLKLSSHSSGENCIEFGAVLVYTCNQSCWSEDSSVRTEHVVLQQEQI